jgi:tRNA pseudouridine synthase 10
MNFEKIDGIMKDGYVCDRCIGRQFAQLLTGTDNKRRGEVVRFLLAMKVDSGEDMKIDGSNFYGFEFHNKKVRTKKPGKCSVCGDIFKELKKKVKQIEKGLKKFEFDTLLLGSVLPDDLLNRENEIWGRIGIEFCESVKSEINREFGKLICAKVGKKVDKKIPDINVIYDFRTSKPIIRVRALYIYGKYKKLVRGIPQTEWKNKIYKTSVQGVIEKPLLKLTKGDDTSFHGSGREDIDARCLGWRPFVIEVKNPKKRSVDLKKVGEDVKKSKKVEVKDLKFAKKIDVRNVKSAKHDKTYRLEVEFEKPLENLEKIDELNGTVISQRTPTRVIRRRSDKTRRRTVKDIKYKVLGENKLEVEVTTEAGLYAKELMSGDGGRTQPNIAELINNKVKNVQLDVIKVHCD